MRALSRRAVACRSRSCGYRVRAQRGGLRAAVATAGPPGNFKLLGAHAAAACARARHFPDLRVREQAATMVAARPRYSAFIALRCVAPAARLCCRFFGQPTDAPATRPPPGFPQRRTLARRSPSRPAGRRVARLQKRCVRACAGHQTWPAGFKGRRASAAAVRGATPRGGAARGVAGKQRGARAAARVKNARKRFHTKCLVAPVAPVAHRVASVSRGVRQGAARRDSALTCADVAPLSHPIALDKRDTSPR